MKTKITIENLTGNEHQVHTFRIELESSLVAPDTKGQLNDTRCVIELNHDNGLCRVTHETNGQDSIKANHPCRSCENTERVLAAFREQQKAYRLSEQQLLEALCSDTFREKSLLYEKF